jgi:hypothetical protein
LIYDVGTRRAAFLLSCHPEELATKDLDDIAQPNVDVPEILRFALDDITSAYANKP